MNPDLYEIGMNLIRDDGSDAGAAAMLGKVTLLQEATDKVNHGLGITGGAIADLTGAGAGIASSWNLAAEAAERMAKAAGGAYGVAPSGNGELAAGTSNAMPERRPDDRSGREERVITGTDHWGVDAGFSTRSSRSGEDFHKPSMEGCDAAIAAVADAIGLMQSKQSFAERQPGDATGIIEDGYDRALIGDRGQGSDAGNAFAKQYADAMSVIQGGGKDGAVAGQISPWRSDEGGRFDELGEAGRSPVGEPAERFVKGRRGVGEGGRDGTMPPDYLASLDHTGLMEFDQPALPGAAGGLLATDVYGKAFGPTMPGSGPMDGGFGIEGEPPMSEPVNANAGQRFAAHLSDYPATAFDSSPASARGTDFGIAPEGFFHDGVLQPDLEGLTGAPTLYGGSGQLLDGMNGANVGHDPFAHHFLPVDSVGGAPDEHLAAPAESFGLASPPGSNAFSHGGTGIGSVADGAIAANSNEGIMASGPPGWLVALTSAVVMGLTNSASQNYTAPAHGSSGGRSSEVGPSGSRNDPLHVKVINQMASYQTHMPVGSTASLPSQSLPAPGQVQFSS